MRGTQYKDPRARIRCFLEWMRKKERSFIGKRTGRGAGRGGDRALPRACMTLVEEEGVYYIGFIISDGFRI